MANSLTGIGTSNMDEENGVSMLSFTMEHTADASSNGASTCFIKGDDDILSSK